MNNEIYALNSDFLVDVIGQSSNFRYSHCPSCFSLSKLPEPWNIKWLYITINYVTGNNQPLKSIRNIWTQLTNLGSSKSPALRLWKAQQNLGQGIVEMAIKVELKYFLCLSRAWSLHSLFFWSSMAFSYFDPWFRVSSFLLNQGRKIMKNLLFLLQKVKIVSDRKRNL